MLGLSRRTTLLAGGVALVVLVAGAFALTSLASPEPLAANAGADQTLECSSPQGATATLDGTGSRPGTNGTVLSYDWYENYNTSSQTHVASGGKVAALFPLGEHRVTLVVSGSRPNETGNATANSTLNETAIDEVVVRVVDTTAPVITAVPSVPSLWPPNHKTQEIRVVVSVSDACGAPSWRLASATSDESDDGHGDGHTTGDLQGADVGAQDTTFTVRAERAGPGDGREYRFTYVATDGSGNSAEATAVVSVPHGE